jgi:ABC-2 type transport system permease protein
MLKSLRHIYRLGLKELISFRYDVVLIVLMIYCFTVMVVVPSKGTGLQMRNSAVAIVDEDQSPLSARVQGAIGKPYFIPPETIAFHDINHSLDRGRYTFVIHIPPGFQGDVLAGKRPVVRLDVDATAVAHAKLGTTYLMRIINDEATAFLHRSGKLPGPPVSLVVRSKYNPNRESRWFMSLVFLMQMITMLSILLPAAALIKEKERQTVEHLLVMPLNPFEISLAKVWANSFLIVTGALLSLFFCVKGIVGTPIIGSVPLFFFGTLMYLFAATELGIFIATIAKNLPQVGLLSMPVIVPIAMLAGGTTPLEAMPPFLQEVMKFSPTAHYLEFMTAVLLRDAGIPDIWPHLAAMGAIGLVLFTGALMRFRATFR